MAKHRRVRVVVRLAPRTVLRYEQLADKFGYSRSELYRVGLEQAFGAVQKWCERARDPDLLFADAVSGPADSQAQPASPPPRSGVSAGTPIARLAAFAGTLVEEAGDVATVRTALLEKADELGLSRAQADPYVDALAADVARASSVTADTPARSRRAARARRASADSPSSPATVPPASESSTAVPSPDLGVEVPELD